MAKKTLSERLAEAEATVAELKATQKLLDSKVVQAQACTIEVEKENNELRDQLMEVTLDRENMRGYLMRAAEDEPQPPIVPTPERRYASGPANEVSYHYHDFDNRNGYRSSNEPPRRWYHR